KSFKDQIVKILDFDNEENPIEFKFNSEWLSQLSFEKIIGLGSNFTVQQMLERDMFEKRLNENKPLFVHEFFYPLMQGYDSVALGVDLEIGGTDQTFNMLAGRTLAKRYLGRNKFVMTTTLLVNPVTGEKLMSKSLGTGIGLNESAENMFGKVMALPDEGVIQTFIDCTRLSIDNIEQKKDRLKSGENPKNIKLELAQEIVSMYHGSDKALASQNLWERTFSEKIVPDDLEEIIIDKEHPLLNILVENNLVESKTQARRLLEEGAIRDATNDNSKFDVSSIISKKVTIKIGKKKFIKINSV
ncbi:MAG: tyrosine--tRNA ligase, partial [Nanoarchaeota archaeon]